MDHSFLKLNALLKVGVMLVFTLVFQEDAELPSGTHTREVLNQIICLV
jgi:hypothetical protein